LHLATILAILGTIVLADPQRPRSSPRPHSVVEAVVNEKGKVESARIVESGGAELDRQALELVKGRKYKPVMKDGEAVKAFLTVTVMPHPEL